MPKHIFDIAASAALIVVLSPVMLVITLAIRATSAGPILHRARRVGQNQRLFTLYKFRTMVVGADTAGPGITTSNDARITRIGHVLRRFKLDELPQLFNVLRGDMSLVGPRPEDPRYVAHYTPEQLRVLRVRPGITSPASIGFRHEESMLYGPGWEQTYVHEIMPAKLQIDLQYLETANFIRDFQVLLQTLHLFWR